LEAAENFDPTGAVAIASALHKPDCDD